MMPTRIRGGRQVKLPLSLVACIDGLVCQIVYDKSRDAWLGTVRVAQKDWTVVWTGTRLFLQQEDEAVVGDPLQKCLAPIYYRYEIAEMEIEITK